MRTDTNDLGTHILKKRGRVRRAQLPVKCAVIEAHRSVLTARGRLVDAFAYDRGSCSANLVGHRLAAQTLAQGLDPF